MNFPSVTRYNLTILKQGRNAFSTLDDIDFVTVKNYPFKEYCFSTGTFAAIYKAKTPGAEYAIRCFLSAREEAMPRYARIQNYLSTKQLPWAVSFKFLSNEITVDGEQYPVIRMGWVNGKAINNFIDEIIFDYRKLSNLQHKLVALQRNLEENSIGHGDLQCGNVLIESTPDDFHIRLVDYDSLYIPEFHGLQNLEAGRQEFQHPKRQPADFSERIDRFSVWVMITAIEAIKIDKNLWKQVTQGGFNTFDNILFSGLDFADPQHSQLFQRLRRLDHKVLSFYVDRLYEYCLAGSSEAVDAPCLFAENGEEEKASFFFAETEPVVQEESTAAGILNHKPNKPTLVAPAFTKNLPQTNDVAAASTDNKVLHTASITFRSDKSSIKPGELVTLEWHVSGDAEISITNIGKVEDREGARTLILARTTEFSLVAGNASKTIIVYVSREFAPHLALAHMQNLYGRLRNFLATSVSQTFYEIPRIIWMAAFAACFSAIFYLSVKGMNDGSSAVAGNAVAAAFPESFTKEKVSGFLAELYGFYNKGYINSIVNHYANHLEQYHELSNVDKQTLTSIIAEQFRSLSAYHCEPAMYSLSTVPHNGYCTVRLTVYEQVKPLGAEQTTSYATVMKYVLNSDYQIVSETIESRK